MCNILHIYSLVGLCIGLAQSGSVWLNQCVEKTEIDNGCPIQSIEPTRECQKGLKANDGEGDFIFYIKPFDTGEIPISLNQRDKNNSHIEITDKLFTLRINDNDKNKWYKIRINASEFVKSPQSISKKYILEVNDVYADDTYPKVIDEGNEIRLKTSVKFIWSDKCDPRKKQTQSSIVPLPLTLATHIPTQLKTVTLPQIATLIPTLPTTVHLPPTILNLLTTQPTTATLPPTISNLLPTQPTTTLPPTIVTLLPSQPSTIPLLPTETPSPPSQSLQPATTTNTGTYAQFPLPSEEDKVSQDISVWQTWQLLLIAVVIMVIILVITLVVIQVFRHRRKSPDRPLVQLTDYQFSLSRFGSKNSLPKGYDNHTFEDNQITRVVPPAAGTEWGGQGTVVNIYEEVDP